MKRNIDSFLTRSLPRVHRDLVNVAMPVRYSKYDDLYPIEVIIILLEDRRFFQHSGIDWQSLLREIYKLITLQKHGGASTIDMQLVRTRTGYKDRTVSRKLYEMLLALLLQGRMSKIAILRTYLAIVYLGSGISGIGTAARKVFDKELSDLTLQEMSMIAAMMVYPRPRAPTECWQERVERRALYGLALFRKYGARYMRKLPNDTGARQ